MSSNTKFFMRMDDVISGDFGSYQIKERMGKGTFGRVARCIDCLTNQSVAIKISQLKHYEVTKNEATILQWLSSLGQDKNVVKFITSFQHQDHYCLVMEHLDQSLYDFMKGRQFKPLHLLDICYITKQLLETFQELEKYKLVHGDLKLDNIMLVNHKVEPLKIKLIDFGFSTTVGSLDPGSVLQAIGYRAPEVSLGTKLDEAVDMWSLGCVMAFLFIGKNFFPEKCEYEMIRIITQIQGMPDVQQLQEGLFVNHFFKEIHGTYQLISPKDYMDTTRQPYAPCKNVSKNFTCLGDMSAYRPQQILEEEKEETGQFFIFLNEFLQVNPAKRITPGKALTHPFIKQMIAMQTTDSRIPIDSCLRSKHSSTTARENDTSKVTTGGPKTNHSHSEDEMKTRNKKIQERVPTGWANSNVGMESDHINQSGCSTELKSLPSQSKEHIACANQDQKLINYKA
ncbi:homeodomain-interacting protein kinase 2-like [Eucyclogobius newberryi]|uniref:homeodomain-interacting protein kinase 2-like n=1 Tax=Eucyclogobius newberryi TaxID=166745 RepID=UPI003B5A89EA